MQVLKPGTSIVGIIAFIAIGGLFVNLLIIPELSTAILLVVSAAALSVGAGLYYLYDETSNELDKIISGENEIRAELPNP